MEILLLLTFVCNKIMLLQEAIAKVSNDNLITANVFTWQRKIHAKLETQLILQNAFKVFSKHDQCVSKHAQHVSKTLFNVFSKHVQHAFKTHGMCLSQTHFHTLCYWVYRVSGTAQIHTSP